MARLTAAGLTPNCTLVELKYNTLCIVLIEYDLQIVP